MKLRQIAVLISAVVSLAVGTKSAAWGQYALDYGFSIGPSNYLGDIGGAQTEARRFFPDMHLSQTKYHSSHIFVRYRVTAGLALKGQIGSVFIQDDDALTAYKNRQTRNAHFRNTIQEASLRAEVNFLSRPLITRYTSKNRASLDMYAILGVTAFAHAPEAQMDSLAAFYWADQGIVPSGFWSNEEDPWNTWYDLRTHRTEGVSYSRTALGIPIGLGASFMVNYRFRLGIEFVWNLTTTDYLDDVSTTWANPNSISSNVGRVLSNPSSAETAARAGWSDPEGAMYHFQYQEGSPQIRGNPERNDTYGTLQVSLSKVIMSSSNFRRANYFERQAKSKRSRPTRGDSDGRNMGRGRAKF